MQNVGLKTPILAEQKFWTPIISYVFLWCLSKNWKFLPRLRFFNLQRHWQTNIICHLLVRWAPNAF